MALPDFIQQDPTLARLLRRERQLENFPVETGPAATPFAGLARVIGSGLRFAGKKKIGREIGERQEELTGELADLLSTAGGGGAQGDTQSATRDLALKLARNPATASIGFGMLTGDISASQTAERQTTRDEAQFERSRQLQRERFELGGGTKATQRQRKIRDLKDRGFSDNDAQDIADGRMTVKSDPITKENVLINRATGEQRRLGLGVGTQPAGQAQPPGQPAQARPAAPTQRPARLTIEERKSLLDANASIDRTVNLMRGLRPEQGTGPGPSTLIPIADFVAGLFGGRAGEESQQQRAKLKNFNQLAKTALVNNPRFPVAEQELVQGLLPDADSFFVNPQAEADDVSILFQLMVVQRQANQAQLDGQVLPQFTFNQQNVDDFVKINPETGAKIMFNPLSGEWEEF